MLAWYLALFCISAFGVWRIEHFALSRGMIDIPNERSSHLVPTPRGGGLAFVIVWAVTNLALLNAHPLYYLQAIVLGGMGIALLSIYEDWVGLSASKRLLVQLLITCTVLTSIMTPPSLLLGAIAALVATLAVVWSINLFNFMDGTDGLAAVEGISIFLITGTLFSYVGLSVWAAYCWTLCAALLGFLCFGWPKARVFMGDVGSTFLGYLVAMTALVSHWYTPISIEIWAMLYSAFWIDATVTLVRRALAREKVTEAHCSHAYQRLHQSGWSHLKLLLGLIGYNVVLALWILLYISEWFPLWTAVSCSLLQGALVLLWIEKKQPRIIMR